MEKPSIEEVLIHYGADRVPTGHRWRPMRCVLHDDRSASASVNTETNKFRCFACDFHGDSIDLIMHKEGTDFHGAVETAERLFGGSYSTISSGPNGKPKRHRVPFDDERTVSGQLDFLSSRGRRKPFAGS